MGETDWGQVVAGASLALGVVGLGFVAWSIIDAARRGRRVREIMRQAGRDIDGAINEANKIREGGDR